MLQRDLHLILGRLDEFTAQVHQNLETLEWSRKREIIRTLVKRVELAAEQVQVVFRVDVLSGEADPGKKSLQLCKRSKHAALWRPFVRVRQCSRLQHASMEPLAK